MKRPRQSLAKAPKRSNIHDSDPDAPVTKRPKRAEPLKPRTGPRRKVASNHQPSLSEEPSHYSDTHSQQNIQSPSELPTHNDSTELDPCSSSPLSNLSDENENQHKPKRLAASGGLSIDALAQSENQHPSPGGPIAVNNEVRERILTHSRQVYEFKTRRKNQELQAEKQWIEGHRDRLSVNGYSSEDDFKITDTRLLPKERDQSMKEPESIVPELSLEESGPSLLLQQDPVPSSERRDDSQTIRPELPDMLDAIESAPLEEFAAQGELDKATGLDVQRASSEAACAVEKLASKEQLLETSNPAVPSSVDITQDDAPFEKEGEEAGASDNLSEPACVEAGRNETDMVHACEGQGSSDHEVIAEKNPPEEKDTTVTPTAVMSPSTETTREPGTARDAPPPENNTGPKSGTQVDQELTIRMEVNRTDVTDGTRVENAPTKETYQGDLPRGAPEEDGNSMSQETKSRPDMDERSEQVACKDPSEMPDMTNLGHQGASECPQTAPRSSLGAMNVIVPNTGDNDEPPQENLQQTASAMDMNIAKDQSESTDEHQLHHVELQASVGNPMVDVVAEEERGARYRAAAGEVDIRDAVADLSLRGEPETGDVMEPTMSIHNQEPLEQAGSEMDSEIRGHPAESADTPTVQFTEQLVVDTVDELHQLHRDELQEAIKSSMVDVAAEEGESTGSRMPITELEIYNTSTDLSLFASQASLSPPIPAFLSLYSEPPSPERRRMPNSDAYDDENRTPRQNIPIPSMHRVEPSPTMQTVNTTTPSALSDILDRVWESVLEMEVSARNGDLQLVGGHSDQIHARLEEAREAALRISQRASQISRLASEL
ncbi:hypothetical protein Moror_7081 [Moniliophthora roreri MCA 2997]|uniref:Uncharacterized protein n=1 Tax=Moniliophthora roreri (strain MCA 2997) TaxID=1381753 RepID=V2XUS3_MONRO|nr:hypothetical protein Moror_7081 [Moniliophthora roreri MCA 2997]